MTIQETQFRGDAPLQLPCVHADLAQPLAGRPTREQLTLNYVQYEDELAFLRTQTFLSASSDDSNRQAFMKVLDPHSSMPIFPCAAFAASLRTPLNNRLPRHSA